MAFAFLPVWATVGYDFSSHWALHAQPGGLLHVLFLDMQESPQALPVVQVLQQTRPAGVGAGVSVGAGVPVGGGVSVGGGRGVTVGDGVSDGVGIGVEVGDGEAVGGTSVSVGERVGVVVGEGAMVASRGVSVARGTRVTAAGAGDGVKVGWGVRVGRTVGLPQANTGNTIASVVISKGVVFINVPHHPRYSGKQSDLPRSRKENRAMASNCATFVRW